MSGKHVDDFDHEDEQEQADRAIRGLLNGLIGTVLIVLFGFAVYFAFLGIKYFYGG